MTDGPENSWSATLDQSPLSAATSGLIFFFAAAMKSPERAAEAVELLARRDFANPALLQEACLAVPLFAGFPRAINVAAAVRRAFPDLPTPPGDDAPLETLAARGEALFRRIYADHSDRVLEALATYHPELPGMILEWAYARVLSRPAIDGATRELMAVAALTVTGDERQLSSHVRGALRLGSEGQAIEDALALTAPFADPAALAAALALVRNLAA